MSQHQSADSWPGAPLKSYATIFKQEVAQAVRELKRPALGIALSGLIAGFGVGVSALLVAAVETLSQGTLSPLVMRFFVANAYAVGFILVILGSTDLFTEYTTIAILPVLTGDAPLADLARAWGLIYGSNLVGGTLFAALAVSIGPPLGLAEPGVFREMALRLLEHPVWVMFLSGLLTGWLMGLLSWLITAGRETISQALFIWLIAGTIGFAHLHHSVVGAIEMIAGALASPAITGSHIGRFILWVTLGNAAGGIVFALLIRYGALISGTGGGLRREDRS